MVGTSLAEVATATDRSGPDVTATRLAVLKAAADPTRLAVLDVLVAHGVRCHCDLEVDLDVPANRLSFHLKVLRDAGLIGSQRCGKRVNYHLEDGAIAALQAALPGGVDREVTT